MAKFTTVHEVYYEDAGEMFQVLADVVEAVKTKLAEGYIVNYMSMYSDSSVEPAEDQEPVYDIVTVSITFKKTDK
jgi:hypothetical protein